MASNELLDKKTYDEISALPEKDLARLAGLLGIKFLKESVGRDDMVMVVTGCSPPQDVKKALAKLKAKP